MGTSARYSLTRDFGHETDPGHLTLDPYWIVAVVRLGEPISFSRKTMDSFNKNLSAGALLRADEPLVITDDILNLSITGGKHSHKKEMHLTLKQTDVNYLKEVLTGDHVLGWICNNSSDFKRIRRQIVSGQPCNAFGDGFKFLGRVTHIEKDLRIDPGSGILSSQYHMKVTGFDELDANFYYDHTLASKDVLERDFGQWLTRVGLSVEALFGAQAKTQIETDNINRLIPTLLDLIVGKGPGRQGNIGVDAYGGQTISATPTYNIQSDQTEAPYAYVIPKMVGKLLGVPAGEMENVLGYTSVVELLMGVQSYSTKSSPGMFVPDLSKESVSGRLTCNDKLLGTFLPFMPDFANRPVWQVLYQYLNPTINEMYTCLRVNPAGRVMPTIVVRQLPLTTEAFTPEHALADGFEGPKAQTIAFTRFLSLPRWVIPRSMVLNLRVGRGDQTRCNFVHVYGANSSQQNATALQEQIVNNPPVIDHVDVMRSGMRPYVASVECFVEDTVSRAPSKWISLIADWAIGSHLTLNGSITMFGVQSPIAEGDAVEFDGIAYMVESVSHQAGINPMDGTKYWHTTLTMTNGMEADTGGNTDVPMYPGLRDSSLRGLDPGLSLEGTRTTGGVGDTSPPKPRDDFRAGSAATDPFALSEGVAPDDLQGKL